jgi:hypothetical protein
MLEWCSIKDGGGRNGGAKGTGAGMEDDETKLD